MNFSLQMDHVLVARHDQDQASYQTSSLVYKRNRWKLSYEENQVFVHQSG